MAFTQRIVALAAVVAVPLGIAATSHVLTRGPDQPDVPRQVRLDEPADSTEPSRPTPTATSTPTPDANQQDGKKGKSGSDEVVPRPKPTSSDDNADDGGGGGDDQADDGAGDDGAGDDGDDDRDDG